MAVLPISSVSSQTNAVTFAGKEKRNKDNKFAGIPERQDSNSLTKVPVIVMLAMAPMMSDGKKPAQIMPIDNKALTEVLAQAPANPMIVEQVNDPKQHPYVQRLLHYTSSKVQHVQEIKNNPTKPALIFGTMNTYPNSVFYVDYVDQNFVNKTPNAYPPSVVGLVYHDLGEGRDFCSILTMQHTTTNGKPQTIKRNIRIDDESAQLLIDLLAGDTKWKNSTRLKFYETTSSKLQPVEVF